MRQSTFQRDRNLVCPRNKHYICWRKVHKDLYGDYNIWEITHYRDSSYYGLYIKDRVFNHNMTYGLTENKFRNFYWKCYYRRQNNAKY